MTNGQALSVLKTKYFNTVQTEKRDIEFWAGLRAGKEKLMKKLWKMALLILLGTCIAPVSYTHLARKLFNFSPSLRITASRGLGS